ncbi:putative fatty acyl-CoA reductase CG5065 [Chironomus tepperi]|uniref:putative fatty acyl-CoA reductase CG5065 n=1 Tax=Chironomus tepperi TaxID=113505 RepID=UPI00391F76D1
MSSVQEFYKDKTIFITGGSGFMGKVLIEKLLYSCSDLKEIIVLMREKHGKTAKMRVDDYKKIRVFERIMNEKPEMMNKIHPIWGDISEPNFGLSDEDTKYITDNTQIVFHLAASLKLEAPLKTNIIMNLTSVKQICDLAKKMKNLVAMIHTSTAFCIVEHENVEERVYEVDIDPLDVIEKARVMSEKELSAVQKKMLGKHLNTYTYTKRLSEVLIRDEFKRSNLPVCFVRPSMVSSAYKEPIYGWVDSLNGAPGFIVAIGRGVLRTLLMDVNTTKNYIPVDTCMNGYILIAKQIADLKERPKEVPVYNLTANESNTMSMGEYFKICIDLKYEYPFSAGLWYPNVAITTNEFYYYINVVLFQWIPALLIDFLLMLFGQRRFMIKIQQKLSNGMDVVQCFLKYNFKFRTENFESLLKIQSPDEYNRFFIDTKKIDTKKLFQGTIIGGREFLGKDPESTLPRARIFIKIQYVLHLIALTFIYYWLFKKFLVITGLMEPVSNFLSQVKG